MLVRIFSVFTRLLSSFCGYLLSLESPAFLISWLIQVYCKVYRVKVEEADKPLSDYNSLQNFFLRELKHGLRPVPQESNNLILSPVDGTLREVLKLEDSKVASVKGIDWQWQQLLVDKQLKDNFTGATCFNMYLSPADYHHVHTPVSSRLRKIIYQPGCLLPVNDWSLRLFPKLFSLNERVILHMQADGFEYLLVMVGALNVGSIKLDALPDFARKDFAFEARSYTNFAKDYFQAGQRIGSFCLGSSVLLIIPEKLVSEDHLSLKDCKIKYAELLANINSDLKSPLN